MNNIQGRIEDEHYQQWWFDYNESSKRYKKWLDDNGIQSRCSFTLYNDIRILLSNIPTYAAGMSS